MECGELRLVFRIAQTVVFFERTVAFRMHPSVLFPEDFRTQYSRNLKDGDVLIAIRQRGERKDLIDAMNGAAAGVKDVFRFEHLSLGNIFRLGTSFAWEHLSLGNIFRLGTSFVLNVFRFERLSFGNVFRLGTAAIAMFPRACVRPSPQTE